MSDVKKRIIDYETAGEVDEDFYLLGDNGTEGTFKIPVKAVGPIESICPVYDAESGTYDEGDYCFYSQKMYQCNTDISVPEDFNSTKWDEVTIAEIMASQQNQISTINNSLTQLDTSDNIYSATNYVNNIGGSVTLSENFTDYKFLKIRVGVGSFDSWNITEFIVANLHTTFSGYYVFTTNHTSVKSVRLSTASSNLKSIGVISSSEASLSIYSVTGIR